jgi:Helix-turn-helix domain
MGTTHGASDRAEFKLARQEAGLTAWAVDLKSGYPRGTVANFEFGQRELTDEDERRLLRFLEVLVAHDCEPKIDYPTVVLAYRKERGLSRAELARQTGLSIDVLWKIESGRRKHQLAAVTREKLDALLFDA